MKETQKEIGKQNDDKYLPFENAEMKQRKHFFPQFLLQTWSSWNADSHFNAGPSKTNTVHKEKVKMC